jgi:hypothetical protein
VLGCVAGGWAQQRRVVRAGELAGSSSCCGDGCAPWQKRRAAGAPPRGGVARAWLELPLRPGCLLPWDHPYNCFCPCFCDPASVRHTTFAATKGWPAAATAICGNRQRQRRTAIQRRPCCTRRAPPALLMPFPAAAVLERCRAAVAAALATAAAATLTPAAASCATTPPRKLTSRAYAAAVDGAPPFTMPLIQKHAAHPQAIGQDGGGDHLVLGHLRDQLVVGGLEREREEAQKSWVRQVRGRSDNR